MRRKMIRAAGRQELKDSFTVLKNKLEILQKDPLEKSAFEYFDFLSWLESKSTGKSFSEIVKEKTQKSNLRDN